MNLKIKTFAFALILGMIFLSACAGGGPQGVSATATQNTVPAAVNPTQAAMDEIQNKVVNIVRSQLASTLNVDVSTLDLKSVEPTNWTDSCLGLGQPNESCAQVVTPGFRVTFSSGGKNYTYRVDLTGGTVRQEP